MLQEVVNNYFVETYLSSEKGVLEAGTSKTLSLNEVYAIAGRASIYLYTYKEPKATSRTGISDNQTTAQIDRMKELKLQAKSCLFIVNSMLKYMNPNQQLALKVKR